MKYSTTIALFLSSASAQGVAVAAPAYTVPQVASGSNAAMAGAVAAVQAKSAGVNDITVTAGPLGAMGLKVNQAAVQDILAREQNFWQNDARRIENQLQGAAQGMVAPLEAAKARIASSMSSILQPAQQALPMMMRMFPNGNTCKPAQFVQCAWNLPRRERREDKIFKSACAVDSGCKPELVWPENDVQIRADDDKIRQKRREMQQAFQKLAFGVSKDLEAGRRQAMQTVGGVAQEWAQLMQTVMVKDMKCDQACLQKTRWDRVNPMDFVGGRCGCQGPIQPGAVVDFSAEDFTVIEMQEWIDIHEKNQANTQEVIEEIDVTELGDKTEPEATPKAPEKETPPAPKKETPPAPETETPPATETETPVSPVGLFTKQSGVCNLEGGTAAVPKLGTPVVNAAGKTLDLCLQACVDDAACLSAAFETDTSGSKPVTTCSSYTTAMIGVAAAVANDKLVSDCYAKGVAGGSAVGWIIGILAAIIVGGLVYKFVIQKKTEEEGGQIDMYSRFIDQETASY